MQRRGFYFFLLLFFTGGFSWADEIIYSEWTGNLNIYGGNKYLLDPAFAEDGNKNQPEAGITLDLRPKNEPVNFLVGYFSSNKSTAFGTYQPNYGETKLAGHDRTEELRFGLRKYWDQDSALNPFIGTGIADIKLKSTIHAYSPQGVYLGVQDLSEEKFGIWLDGGIMITLREHLNFGVSAAYSTAEVNVGTDRVDVGGVHLLAFVGAHW